MRALRLLVPLLAAALAGCPPRVPPPDLSLDPAALAAQVRAAQALCRTVRGEARIRIESADFTGTIPALVAAEKPDRLLVQTLDFFGNAAAVLASADGVLSLYDARANVLYRGAATPENLARLIPLPVSPADLAAILCGSAPLLAGEPVSAEPGRGHVTLVIAGDALSQTLRVGPGAAVLASTLRGPDGGRPAGTYDLAFDRHETLGGVRFPGEASLSAETPRVRMKLVWVDVEPGAALDARTFTPRVPASARVVDLGDAAPPAGLLPAPGDAPRPAE